MQNFLINKVFATLIALLSIMACSTKVRDIETIMCSFTSQTPLYQCEWIESITFTPLDTACLIGAESELRLVGDNLFIKHGPYQEIRIDRFNTNGVFLNRIGRLGRGPGEYVNLSDWFIYEGNQIGLNAYGPSPIMLYDFDGNFVREINRPLHAFMVHPDNSHFWALMPPIADSARLTCFSEDGMLKSMYKSESTYSASSDLWRTFFKTNKKLYIGMPYENTILLVQKDTVHPVFFIDAGAYAIPKEFYANPFESFIPMMEKGYAAVYNFLESKDYLVLQMVTRQNEFEGMLFGIKNLRENKWFWSRLETWPSAQNRSDYQAAEITEDNKLFILIPPDEIKEHLPFMNNVINRQILESLTDDANPVLVEIGLR